MKLRLIKQTRPKSCNIACLQMVGEQYGKSFSEAYIVSKLPQHAFGNWLSEMAMFLESEGIPTTLYTNSLSLPRKNAVRPSLYETLIEYQQVGKLFIQPLTVQHFQNTLGILNIDRAKLYSIGKGPTPHYVVLMTQGDGMSVYDPLADTPLILPKPVVLAASYAMNKQRNNGLFLSIGERALW